MRWFLTFINNTPKDKLEHVYVSVFLCLSFFVAAILNINAFWAYLFCAAVAAGNEIYQKEKKTGKFEVKDIVYTMLVPTLFYLYTLLNVS